MSVVCACRTCFVAMQSLGQERKTADIHPVTKICLVGGGQLHGIYSNKDLAKEHDICLKKSNVH